MDCLLYLCEKSHHMKARAGTKCVVLLKEGHYFKKYETFKLMPLLDYSVEPFGARYPVKVFASISAASEFLQIGNFKNFVIIPTP